MTAAYTGPAHGAVAPGAAKYAQRLGQGRTRSLAELYGVVCFLCARVDAEPTAASPTFMDREQLSRRRAALYFKNTLASSYATAVRSMKCMRQLRNAREGRLKIAPHHSRPVIHGTSLRTTCSATYMSDVTAEPTTECFTEVRRFDSSPDQRGSSTRTTDNQSTRRFLARRRLAIIVARSSLQ
ncbi:hypothetical protein CC86DRAFT_385928 [Ophiobolus disseminans]|uniref:Uncharacterized protein n=1 Tax=Ophiobolus disseminans TaxID=1469910 RepID=A0A6A6ZMA3_9PLEO|nr:hypothetical protein CC86DRAFT_385928 [Ophiobolus disseminans]